MRHVIGGAALVPGHDDGYVFIAFRPDLLRPIAGGVIGARREVDDDGIELSILQ